MSGYIVDFSREFHDEEATRSNITRAVHLFEQAEVDAEVFIEHLYAARNITQGRANIQKRSAVGKNPAWPAGFPNRMPYFFRVLEEKLGLSGRVSSEAEDEQVSGGLSQASAAEASRVEEAVDGDSMARPRVKARLAEGVAVEDGGSRSGQEESLAAAHSDSPTVPEPTYVLPEEVEVAEAATVATWRDYLPDPEASQPRAVLMLWGFARDALRDQLNTARRSQLDALIPKWEHPARVLCCCSVRRPTPS